MDILSPLSQILLCQVVSLHNCHTKVFLNMRPKFLQMLTTIGRSQSTEFLMLKSELSFRGKVKEWFLWYYFLSSYVVISIRPVHYHFSDFSSIKNFGCFVKIDSNLPTSFVILIRREYLLDTQDICIRHCCPDLCTIYRHNYLL